MPDAAPAQFQTAWLGTAAVWFAYGQTSLLVDGFFSRPSLARVVGARLHPDPEQIASGLSRAGITRLDAFLAGHTHYDHVLDAPVIARLTGAVLAGSSSFAHLARAEGIAENQIQIVEPGDHTQFGPLRVEWIASRHNHPDLARGEIPARCRLPAHARAYRGGTMFALRILSPAGTLGVLGSAGSFAGMFDDRPVDSLFLSIAGLSRLPDRHFSLYFDQSILSSQARILYPIHWDDFFRPISTAPQRLPRLLDDIQRSMDRLQGLCAAHRVQLIIPPFFLPFDPFSDVK